MKTLALVLLAACGDNLHPAIMPPAEPCPDTAAMPVVVPSEAPCSVYERLDVERKILPVAPHIRILVARVPFDPLWGEGDPIFDGAMILVWGPKMAGDRLGAVGRIDPSDPTRCAWEDAAP